MAEGQVGESHPAGERVIVVYTTIFGGSDSLKPAPVGADRAVCFVDRPSDYAEHNGWELLALYPDNPRRAAWHLRCVAHELFPDASTTVWIDASFTLTNLPRLLNDAAGHPLSALKHHTRSSAYDEGREVVKVGQALDADVTRQMDAYRRDGFRPSALSISCVLVRTSSPKVIAFNTLWDAEIKSHPGDNTQLSLDYCAWKAGIGVHHLSGVRKDNPYAVHDHADHKRRRKPYR